VGCVVRIVRETDNVLVYFESNLVLLNNTPLDLEITADNQRLTEQQVHNFKSQKVLVGSLSWFRERVTVKVKSSEEAEGTPLFVSSVSTIFDSRLDNPSQDFSKIVKLG